MRTSLKVYLKVLTIKINNRTSVYHGQSRGLYSQHATHIDEDTLTHTHTQPSVVRVITARSHRSPTPAPLLSLPLRFNYQLSFQIRLQPVTFVEKMIM